NPSVVLLQLIALLVDRHLEEQEQGENELDDRDNERQTANPCVVITAQEEQRERTESREEDDDREQVAARNHGCTIPCTVLAEGHQNSTAMIRIAPTTTHTA